MAGKKTTLRRGRSPDKPLECGFQTKIKEGFRLKLWPGRGKIEMRPTGARGCDKDQRKTRIGFPAIRDKRTVSKCVKVEHDCRKLWNLNVLSMQDSWSGKTVLPCWVDILIQFQAHQSTRQCIFSSFIHYTLRNYCFQRTSKNAIFRHIFTAS